MSETPESTTPIFRRLGPAGILGILWMILPPAGGFVLLANIQAVSEFLRARGGDGIAIYSGAFALLAGFALLPTYAQAVVGGWAFGLAVGVPAALAGFVGAALIGYEIARRASGDRVERIIREKPKWAAVREALIGGTFWKTLAIVALVRLPPNSPFAITNLVMASTRVPRSAHILGTAIGMLPRTAAAVYLGTTIGALTNDSLKATPKWYWVAGLVATLVVLLVLVQIGKHAIARVTGVKPTPQPPVT